MLHSLPLAAILLLAISTFTPYATANEEPAAKSATCKAQLNATLNYNFTSLGTDQQVNLCDSYADKLILVVNTASKCGYTPQYEGLESLYARYKERGLVVLGFPSNDFAGQEPGTAQQIKKFCRLTYGVQFPMFEKVSVRKGAPNQSPFFSQLAAMSGEHPGWNFHKYLIGANGKLLASFKSQVRPNDPAIVSLIEQNLPAVLANE